MSRYGWFLSIALLMGAVILAACASENSEPRVDADMPNPAAVYCQEQGHLYEIRTATDGSQSGVCILADGSECDEWAFFRGECPSKDTAEDSAGETESTPVADMPNPASVYCEENGGLLALRPDAAGNVAGVCVFPDGSECDEWAYFREECRPGDNRPQPEPTAPAGFETSADGWKVFYNEALAYSFAYPPDASIEDADDPLHSLTVLGPFVDDDHWPFIFVSHPSGREDYSPPEGVDLAQWLVDHNLLPAEGQELTAEVRQPDVTMAGTTAVHTRFERSPQSYAYDKYFFAHGEQLYTVVIVHTGDREDWQLYDRFLSSFRFY